MSGYSRGGEGRGTTTIESTPALRQPSKPVFSSRVGLGASLGECGSGEIEKELLIIQYGSTLKPDSDWMPMPGTTGLTSTSNISFLPALSLSSATTVSTR